MDAVRLARLTTPLVVAVVGITAGHVMMPYAAGASLTRRAAFWLLMLAVGAFRGWREGIVSQQPASRWRARSVLYAIFAGLLAFAAYRLVHGPLPAFL